MFLIIHGGSNARGAKKRTSRKGDLKSFKRFLLGIQSLLHGLLSELLLLSLLQLFELKKEFNFWEFEFLGKSENLVLAVSTLDNEKEGVFRCSIDMMPCTLTVEHRNTTRFWASLWLPEMALCAFCA